MPGWNKSTNYLISLQVFTEVVGLNGELILFCVCNSSLVDIRYLEFRVKARKSTWVFKRHEHWTSCVGLILAQAMEVQRSMWDGDILWDFVIEAQIYVCFLDGLYSRNQPSWMNGLWMNLNRVNIWFHLGNPFCEKKVVV
jgi:hypothetical protein